MREERTRPAWFDAHLDLAYLAVNGRDLFVDLEDLEPQKPPASITLPSLQEGNVTHVLATIFTEANGKDQSGYPEGDVEAAHQAGLRQLRVYRKWETDGFLRRFSEPAPSSSLRYGILIECADPIRSPDELSFWKDRGVVAVGMAWWKSSRYAGGNGTDEGLTPAGHELAEAMDELGIVHDLSHLPQKGVDQLLEITDRPVMASHSNCRSLLDGRTQRHLADETILEIGRRKGMIGINLITPFLVHHPGYFNLPVNRGLPRATLDDVVRHVERICEIQGSRSGVGLGTDADGGVSALVLPRGIDRPRDYEKIASALLRRGWTEEEVDGFRFGNWARFWGISRTAATPTKPAVNL